MIDTFVNQGVTVTRVNARAKDDGPWNCDRFGRTDAEIRSQFEIAQLIGTQGVTIRLRIAKLLSAIHSATFSRGVNFTTLL